MARIDLPYVYADTDRHGNVRVYFQRRGGRKTRLREEPGSAEFHARYAELLAAPADAASVAATSLRPQAGTLGWLVTRYTAAPAFRALDAKTQRIRRRRLEQCLDEPVAPGEAALFRDFPLARLTPAALAVLRDRKAATPEAANERVKALRAALAWGVATAGTGVAVNPARDVAYLRTGSTGWPAWTVDDVAAYEARHPVGTMARLALDLLLYTGARRSDVVRLGRAHRRQTADGPWLRWTAAKNRRRKPTVVEIPLLPELAASIDATRTGDLTWLVSEAGRPFGLNYFGNWFARRCGEAGLTGLSAHGLRKAGAARAAENGATDSQLMAIFGWTSIREAQRYTRSARRRVMAAAAVHLLAPPSPTVRRGGKHG